MQTPTKCPHCGTEQPTPHHSPWGPGTCFQCGVPLVETAITPALPAQYAQPAVAPGRPPEHEPPYVLPVGPGPRGDGPAPYLPPVPPKARAAGIIWIVFGGLILLNALVAVLLVMALAPPGAQGAFMSGAVCGGGFMGLIGGAFIFVGVQTVTGSANDTLGNGIGSIIFGAILVLFALLSVGVAGPAGLIGMLIYLASAGGLLTAGILALIDREKYLDYRYAHRPPRRRPRRDR